MNAQAFEESLTQLVLAMPMTLRAPQQGWLVRVSYASNDAPTYRQRLMSKSFVGLCKPDQHRPDCLSLLDDVMGLSPSDKLGVALGLSLDPLRESITRAVERTLAPQLFYTFIATSLITWAVLAANPEPVFTKAAAIASALLLIYLGVEVFLELVDASRELKRATDKATTPEALKRAAQRFANRVGPEVTRVFLLAVTVAMSQGMAGGAAFLTSRLSMLPALSEAAAVGGARVSVSVASVGEVRAVAVAGNTVIISLPSSAVAMVAQRQEGGQASSEASGQQHHPISKPIAEELANHPTLRGHYTARDPRFVTRAADRNSHNGYQRWHREVDEEVIAWLRTHRKATPEEFESFLRQLYSRPAMRARFPHGF